MSHTFLVEIGTEELPPKSLKALSDALTLRICKGLKDKEVSFEKSRAFATPRRLGLIIEGLAENTPLRETTLWGPSAKIAFDEHGNPTKAAEAFASKNGVTVASLSTVNDGKQDKLVCEKQTGGLPTKSLLGEILRGALSGLPIKKRMRWGTRRDEFVRPVQWLVLLFDNEVLQENILGVQAGNQTRGHRFHANEFFTIKEIRDYESLLLNTCKVVADFNQRKALIKKQVFAAAKKINGKAIIEEALLDEVTALVEWPVALSGQFDRKFLSVPPEALISSMNEHQKYFHVVDESGKLLPYFITVSNIQSNDAKQVVDGNERVIRPRLADAAFFFDTDKKTTLTERREKLKTLTFQAKLGSVYDKTERIKTLSLTIAKMLKVDSLLVNQAAELCKSDLVSSMVYEFPDMQGIAGYHYAKHEKLPDIVAVAIREQYMPKFAGDAIPSTDIGAIIALADRIDTLTGIFSIGERPTGSKDPFALRRASLGILRILIEKPYDLDIKELIGTAASLSGQTATTKVVSEVTDYCLDRLKAWYQDRKIAPDVFQSVQARNLSRPSDIDQRVHAVAAFTKLEQAPALAEANKRVSNILAKQSEFTFSGKSPNYALFEVSAEKELADKLAESLTLTAPLIKDKQYSNALSALTVLKEPIDNYFEKVMVMTENGALRENRLILLNQLRSVFLEVADISYLAMKA